MLTPSTPTTPTASEGWKCLRCDWVQYGREPEPPFTDRPCGCCMDFECPRCGGAVACGDIDSPIGMARSSEECGVPRGSTATTATTFTITPSWPEAPTATAPGRWGYFVPSNPMTRPVAGSKYRLVELCEDLRYRAPDGNDYYAHKGAVTNGANIPWLLAPIAGQRMSGPHLLAAFIHDEICKLAEAIGGAVGLAMRQNGDALFGPMVRAGGGGAWSALSKGHFVKWGTLGTRIRGDWRRAGSADGPPV